jgi:hypothetical protein
VKPPAALAQRMLEGLVRPAMKPSRDIEMSSVSLAIVASWSLLIGASPIAVGLSNKDRQA